VPVIGTWGLRHNEIFCKNHFLGDIKIKKGSCETMKKENLSALN